MTKRQPTPEMLQMAASLLKELMAASGLYRAAVLRHERTGKKEHMAAVITTAAILDTFLEMSEFGGQFEDRLEQLEAAPQR